MRSENQSRESVAMGESLITHIKTDDNLSDFLTKTTSGAKRRKLVSGVVHDLYDNFTKQYKFRQPFGSAEMFQFFLGR